MAKYIPRHVIEIDMSEFYPGYPEMRKAKYYPGTMPPEYTVERASKAKGKNPNIYKHIVKDASGNTYEVRSKFPGRVSLGEVKSRKFMDRTATIKDAASRVDGTGVTKFETPPDEKAKASIESFNKETSKRHFKETSAEPTSNSTVKNSIWNKLKNSKASNWLKNSKVGSYFTDSPLTPQNVALTYKGWTGQANPVAYQLMQGMGSGGGYMPLPGDPEKNRDRLRVENHPEDLIYIPSNVVRINDKGTVYLDPKLGIQNTEVVTDPEGWKYYRNAQTGKFEALDIDAPHKYYIPFLNDILNGALSMPKAPTPLPIPPMQGPYNSSTVPENQTPLPESYSKMDSTSNGGTSKQLAPILEDVGRVSPDSATASTNARVKPTVNSIVKSTRRAIKPRVVNNTPVTPVVSTPTPASNVPTSNVSAPVAAPTLSSVASQAIRHNGGFDNYRRQSVLSALRAAGGISPAEAVQRGIIPWEALNYV